MPTDILIYMIVAAVMVFWLRNVLGTRHGDEKDRPNPFDVKNQPESENQDNNDGLKSLDIEPMGSVSKKEKSYGDKVDAGLMQIALADRSFDVGGFSQNASDAFSIIVTAFAEGDRETLKDMCTAEVYDAFDGAIIEREDTGEMVSTEIHAVRKADITDAELDKNKDAFVTIRFTADQTYVISDKNGNVVAGHPDRVTEMIDKWTFTRNLKSSDPRWFLCKTDDDVVEEDGKTPIPDVG